MDSSLLRHFIEFVVVEPKQFAGSNVNVILTRQTRGQHLSVCAGSKRRALAFYGICHMFLVKGFSDSSVAQLVRARHLRDK